MQTDKSKALQSITWIYLLVAFIGFILYLFTREFGLFLAFLWADLGMTVVTFIWSLLKRNSSVYDAYWSVIPFYFVLGWMILEPQSISYWSVLVYLILSVWSWRLTLNWARSWEGYHHEDWRYRDLATKTGQWYPLVNFFGIHLFPTLMVFVCMWPLFSIPDGGEASVLLCIAGLNIAGAGIYLEYIADNQLAVHRRLKSGEILSSGIWSKVRHPNYLGEMLFWWGMGICGLAFGAPFYTLSGALALTLMFLFVSIPMKEKHMQIRYADFDAYKRRVPMLIPEI